MTLEKMCPAEVFKYFYDGQSVIDKVKQEVMKTIEAQEGYPLIPVRAILVDFNMPQKDGVEVIQEVNAYYDQIIEQQEFGIDKVRILIKPKFVMITGDAATQQKREYFKKRGAEIIIQKPYDQGRITEVMELVYQKELDQFKQI